jgi:hypothetical protein
MPGAASWLLFGERVGQRRECAGRELEKRNGDDEDVQAIADALFDVVSWCPERPERGAYNPRFRQIRYDARRLSERSYPRGSTQRDATRRILPAWREKVGQPRSGQRRPA